MTFTVVKNRSEYIYFVNSSFTPTDGSWYWVTTDAYGGPGGAIGDGETDDRSAIQAVINAAASQGKASTSRRARISSATTSPYRPISL
jgi:hypothetical protein